MKQSFIDLCNSKLIVLRGIRIDKKLIQFMINLNKLPANMTRR